MVLRRTWLSPIHRIEPALPGEENNRRRMTDTTPREAFARQCHEGGFDLVQAFDPKRLDDIDLGGHSLGDVPGGLGLLVAHSRALWTPFLAQRSEGPHPLDRHCERVVTQAARQLGAPAHCFFSHHAPHFPIQRVAETIGFAALSPSHLCLHPDHGPWVGLRAVVIAELPFRGSAPPPLPHPCVDCDRPCIDALNEAMASASATWRDWLAVRDACPVGRGSRYGGSQLRYHYTKDPRWLVVDP